MISAEGKPSPQDSTDTSTWKYCKFEHEEIRRYHYTTAVFEDKLLILGGQYDQGICPNIVVLNPANQTFKVIPSRIDEVHEQRDPSVCYWEDNKFVVFGGENACNNKCTSAVSILTLKDLESENPSADLKTIETSTQVFRGRHSAHIYEDKMYVFGGVSTTHEPDRQEVWCLDLTTFTWSQVNFKGWTMISGGQFGLLQLVPVFHENKAYMIPFTHFQEYPEITIQEFDLDTMTCEEIKIPKGPVATFSQFSHQILDGKLYCFIQTWIETTESPKFDFWTLDLSSKNWVQLETKQQPPGINRHAHLVLCNNQLVYQGSDELWTLPFTKQSTPVNITKSQQNWKDLLFEAPYADISFEVESEIIKAHKWVLAKNCKYFANMFASGMSEAQASTIKITDMNVSIFKALLEFLYSDHVELNSILALELLKQADKYSIPELQKECETFLSKNIDPENFVLIGQIAELLEAETLREAAVAYITKNIKKLQQRKDFNDLPETLLRDTIGKSNAK